MHQTVDQTRSYEDTTDLDISLSACGEAVFLHASLVGIVVGGGDFSFSMLTVTYPPTCYGRGREGSVGFAGTCPVEGKRGHATVHDDIGFRIFYQLRDAALDSIQIPFHRVAVF